MADDSVRDVLSAKDLLTLSNSSVRALCLKAGLHAAHTRRVHGHDWERCLRDFADVAAAIEEHAAPTGLEKMYLGRYYYGRGEYEQALHWHRRAAREEGGELYVMFYLAFPEVLDKI